MASCAGAAVDGDVENGSLVVGQNLGLLDAILPASVIMQELIAGYSRVAPEQGNSAGSTKPPHQR
ncbi:hypothetical protein FM996_18750 [Methylosinus sporium]|uniref:Uncharacterized protein n=1 Tax=Methylosinus sporium TaxID=428 RepID=A0A549SEW6_METSR|nr:MULTISPECIES: hypothetical protein [Methylosinus]MBU3890391.1 hypothetical protein [Methylosinus sp. KRF6]TRL27763.1 hypothetical protein FM996_18750 [Methylosinus sporium]